MSDFQPPENLIWHRDLISFLIMRHTHTTFPLMTQSKLLKMKIQECFNWFHLSRRN